MAAKRSKRRPRRKPPRPRTSALPYVRLARKDFLERCDLCWQFLRRNPVYRASFAAVAEEHGAALTAALRPGVLLADLPEDDPDLRRVEDHLSRKHILPYEEWKRAEDALWRKERSSVPRDVRAAREAAARFARKWGLKCIADPQGEKIDPRGDDHPFGAGSPAAAASVPAIALGESHDPASGAYSGRPLSDPADVFGRGTPWHAFALNLHATDEEILSYLHAILRTLRRHAGKRSGVTIEAYRTALRAWDLVHDERKSVQEVARVLTPDATAETWKAAVATARRAIRAGERLVNREWANPLTGRRG